jgi:hypothetical protein
MSLTKVTYSMIVGAPANVRDFGAVGDGVTNDAAAIQAADTYASANGLTVFFDGADYVLKSPVTISAPWVGVPRQTRIIVGTPFTFPAPTFDPRNYSAITNLNCDDAFNSSTADNVFITGIDFLNNATNVIETVAIANVKGGALTNCQFTTGTSAVNNPVDLFACVKNFVVQECQIKNLTQNASGGGCLWVRNITSDGTVAANVTENISIVDCYFEQTSLDEALAVYGVNGLTKNVRITRCTFNGTVTSTQRHGNLVTVFPLGSTANAAVQDVVISECRLETNNFIDTALRVGASADSARVCKDIRIENCYIKASLPSAGTAAIARNIPCVGGNVTFVNNTVDGTGSANAITYGVQQFDVASICTATGSLSNAFFNCPVVDGCYTSSVSGVAAFNCARVTNCVFSTVATSIICNETAKYDILNNSLTVTEPTSVEYGVNFNTVASSAPYGEITGNIVNLNNANAFAFRVAGGAASDTRVCGNRVIGTGKTVTGTQLKEVQGNNWYGTLDSLRSAGYIDYDHNFATPIGTYATAITHTAGANSYLLGFIKTVNAGAGSDWKTIYAGNALT